MNYSRDTKKITAQKLPYFLDVAEVWEFLQRNFLLLLNSKHYPPSPVEMETGFTLINGGLKIKNACLIQGMHFLIFNFNIINGIFNISQRYFG